MEDLEDTPENKTSIPTVFSCPERHVVFLPLGQVLSETCVSIPVSKPFCLALYPQWISYGMCPISERGSVASSVSLQCLEKRLAMASWRQGSHSNVLLRFAQLSDPGDNQ